MAAAGGKQVSADVPRQNAAAIVLPFTKCWTGNNTIAMIPSFCRCSMVGETGVGSVRLLLDLVVEFGVNRTAVLIDSGDQERDH